MTDREAMQQALEALEFHVKNADEIEEIDLALVTALRERLAQPEQEPVCAHGVVKNKCDFCKQSVQELVCVCGAIWDGQELVSTPPQRKPLTDEEISDAVREADFDWHYGWTLDDEEPNRFTKFARAIEAKLKEKNT